MSALTWKSVAWVLTLDVLLIYGLQVEHPIYALILALLLWKIVQEDMSVGTIDTRLLVLLFIIGALLHEWQALSYLWQCGLAAAVFVGSYYAEQTQRRASYLRCDLIGLMIVSLYDLLVLPLPHPFYQMIFHPSGVWAICGEIAALAAVVFLLRSHIEQSMRHRIFYAIIFGICNPIVSLISMLIGSLIRLGETRFKHSPYIRWMKKC